MFYDNLFVGVAENSALIFDGESTAQPITGLYKIQAVNQRYFATASQPGFVDGANRDYRLTATSPARDVGTDTTFLGVTTDLRGVDRDPAYDIGAYEYTP